jgi:beta-glucosidase
MASTFDAQALADSLTIEEASTLLHGKDFWRLNGVPRLNVPVGLKVSDGPNGAR